MKIRELSLKTLIIIAWLMFFLCTGIVGTIQNTYKYTGHIITCFGNRLVIEDTTGNIWEYECEGYRSNDKVSILFFNSFTDNRKDDVIMKIKKI